jgi:hypothetical protein
MGVWGEQLHQPGGAVVPPSRAAPVDSVLLSVGATLLTQASKQSPLDR